jgi:hypothetical protein
MHGQNMTPADLHPRDHVACVTSKVVSRHTADLPYGSQQLMTAKLTCSVRVVWRSSQSSKALQAVYQHKHSVQRKYYAQQPARQQVGCDRVASDHMATVTDATMMVSSWNHNLVTSCVCGLSWPA